jgi:hypothetical protein
MKFRKIIFIAVTVILSSCSERFQKTAEKNVETSELLKRIQPNTEVQYWQLESTPNFKDDSKSSEILYSNSRCTTKEKKGILNKKYDWSGFFSGCQPSYCAYRITYLENNKWKVVKSEQELKNFIGEIDNEYEAFLIGKINDYSIDAYSEKGNGFIKEKNGFKIKMMIYNSCPESKESFIFFVNTKGEILNLKSDGFYFKSKNCITY